MIGNDIVDLELVKVQSNWKREGFLDKIFTQNEQKFIHESSNPAVEIWKLWTRKEAAYKIYNRQTGIRGYFPWKLECSTEEIKSESSDGFVAIEDAKYYTQTFVNEDYVYSIAATSIQNLKKIRLVHPNEKIMKINDLPYIQDSKTPVSITHHGRFERIVTLLDS